MTDDFDRLTKQLQDEIAASQPTEPIVPEPTEQLNELMERISTLETLVDFLYEHLVLEKPEV